MSKHLSNILACLHAGDSLLGSAARTLQPAPRQAYAYGLYLLEAACSRPKGGLGLAVAGDPGEAARALCSRLGLVARPVSGDSQGLLLSGGERRITVLPLPEGGIDAVLGRMGFSVEAIALDLAEPEGRVFLDPHRGMSDLEQGRLRLLESGGIEAEPARLLQAAELCMEYGLAPCAETAEALRGGASLASLVAGDRAWTYLSRLFSERMAGSAGLLAEWGMMEALLPEVADLYGVPQNYYHHAGVWEHTLEVLERLESMVADPRSVFKIRGSRVEGYLAEPVESGASRRAYLGFAGLIHDIGKASTISVTGRGRIRFQGHQKVGAGLAANIAARFGLGRAGSALLVGTVRDHMRFGFLLEEGENTGSRLKAVEELGDHCVEVVLLSLADRMATRGPAATKEGLERFRRTCLRALNDYYWLQDTPALIGGHDVMIHTGTGQGQEVGEALFKARVAQREGLITSRPQALEFLAPDFKGRMETGGGVP